MLDGQESTRNRGIFREVEKGFLSDKNPQQSEGFLSEKSLLVHITKSVHKIRGVIGLETEEIQWLKINGSLHEYCPFTLPEDALFERYQIQNSARKILQCAPHPRGPDGRWKVVFCLRHLLQMASHVAVMLSNEFGKAHYKNLIVCGSVWTCPLCAAKVTTGRGQEIEAALNVHTDAGGVMYMVTYTFSHSRQDSLIDLLGGSERVFGLRAALRRLRNSRDYKKLLAFYGFVGLIRSLEITQSPANGWHPHVHELLLFTRKLTVSELREFKRCLFDLWHKACLDSVLALPNRKYGVDVVWADSPAEYMQKFGREQKWGAGAELTRSHVKRSRDREGRTPFDLLRIATEKQDYSGYEAKLFIEYATVFYGSRQCFWSRGLKQLFGIGEVSDEQIAEREDDKAQLVATIDRETWRKVLKQSSDCRAAILRLAETGGKSAVESFLASL